MKAFRFTALSFVLIFGLTLCLRVSSVEAGTYRGNYCWVVTCTNTDIVDMKLKLKVSRRYAGHYELNGTAEYAAWAGVGTAHGNMEVVGNIIILGVDVIASDPEGTWHAFYSAVLDSNLNGTYKGIQTVWDFAEPVMIGENPELVPMVGTFTLTRCR